MQSNFKTLKRVLLASSLAIVPIATFMVHSGFTSAAPNDDICVVASMVSDSSIKSTQGDCSNSIVGPVATPSASPSATPTATVTSSPAPSAPVDASLASCKQVTFQATPGVTISCAVDSAQTWQDNYKITVTTASATPIKWSVDVDNEITKNFVRVDLDSPNAFDRWTAPTRQFTVTGTDRSWNGDVNASNNYAYVSSSKTIVFYMRAIWT